MANECFLKGLCLQRSKSKTYRRIHPIKDLVEDARLCGLKFDSKRFDSWPSFQEMSDLRYGTGTRNDVMEVYKAYLLTLELCHAAATALNIGADTGKARFLIQPLPHVLQKLRAEEK